MTLTMLKKIYTCTRAIKWYQTCLCNLETLIIYFQTNMNWAAIHVKTDVFIYLAYSTVEPETEK